MSKNFYVFQFVKLLSSGIFGIYKKAIGIGIYLSKLYIVLRFGSRIAYGIIIVSEDRHGKDGRIGVVRLGPSGTYAFQSCRQS